MIPYWKLRKKRAGSAWSDNWIGFLPNAFRSFWNFISMGWDILNIFFCPLLLKRPFVHKGWGLERKEFGNLTGMKTKDYCPSSFCSIWHTNKVLWSTVSQRSENPCSASISGETSQSRWGRHLNTDDNFLLGEIVEREHSKSRGYEWRCKVKIVWDMMGIVCGYIWWELSMPWKNSVR